MSAYFFLIDILGVIRKLNNALKKKRKNEEKNDSSSKVLKREKERENDKVSLRFVCSCAMKTIEAVMDTSLNRREKERKERTNERTKKMKARRK